jgi:beta-ketoacyl-acyl-carrier-protein synthase II
MKRVVVTGMGAITPIGNDINSYKNALWAGVSGAAPITRFNAEKFRTRFACELKNFNPADHLDKSELRKTDLFTQYALIVAEQAIQDSGIDFSTINPFDAGVIWGTGQGGMDTFEKEVKQYVQDGFTPRFSPFFVPRLIANMASGMISIKYRLMGINYTAVSACATSNTAIMDALNYIRWGKAKVMITGGSESPISDASIGGFCSMKAMSARNDDPATASRPFDVHRDGFVMGEGAGALVLEEYEHAVKRGAKIYAEVAGAAMTSDAWHMTATHPEGLGASRGMELALQDAGLNSSDVDYLNMHATSTPVGDISEIRAVMKTFGNHLDQIHVSATKSMTGHLLGAAGAIEAIACIASINDGIIPPTINTQELDPEIPASVQIVLKQPLEKKVNVAMSNTFGFGGHNGIAMFKRV